MKHFKIFILSFLLFLPHVIYAATTWNTAVDGKSTTLQPSPYENNSNVSTTLSIASATRLSITINGETEAKYDFLYITDSSGNERKFDGSLNTSYIVTGSSITIRFTSDYSVTRSGVTVSIMPTVLPPTPDGNFWNVNAQGNTAILNPKPYLDKKDTDIQALTIANATLLTVTVSGEIEDQSSCNYDYLTIQNAAGSYTHPGSKNNRFCGVINQTFTVSGDHINIFFHADNSVHKDGVTVTIANASPNTDPVGNAGVDQTINLGDNLILDGSLSSDDGSIVDYTWTENNTIIGTGEHFTLSGLGAGIHTFTLTVTDNDGLTNSDTINVRVNTAPIANAGSDINVTTGETVIFNGSGSSDDYNSITYSWTEGTIPLNLTGVAPSVIFSTAGTYTITLTVTDDNGLSSTDTMVVRVNTAPVAEDANLTLMQNSSISFELNATDADGDAIVSFPIFTEPSHGSLSGTETNMTYTPDANYTGTDYFTYKAYDGTSYSNEATIHFTIIPSATAEDDNFITAYHTLLIGNVLNNDSGVNIELVDFNTTPNGLLNISSDGEFSYIPNERFDGNDTFTYTIKDEFGNTSTATVTILIYPPRNDMSIVKTAPTQVDVGLDIDYTLTISSAAGDEYITAENVIIKDRLPIGVSYTGITAPTDWVCGHVSGTVTCDISSVAPGYSGTIVIHAKAPHILGDSINHAEVGSDTIDPDLSNNKSSATTNIVGLDVDLGIIKTASSPTVNISSEFFYTIRVQNSGTADTSGVSVTDTLVPGLNFIDIDGGSDWSCPQGRIIDCSYIANGGILAAGARTADIVIKVDSPPVEGTITNTAKVKSDNLEVNTANNSDSVDVQIVEGRNITGEVNLTKKLQYNLYGDMKLIGNANINWDGIHIQPNTVANPPLYNDTAYMTYVDTDSDTSTFNSSSSRLNLDSTYKIVWAGLYWEGKLCDYASEDNYCQSPTQTAYNSFNKLENHRGDIRLKIPGDTQYRTITATDIHSYPRNTNTTSSWSYSAFANITNIIDSNASKANGSYTVANIPLSWGYSTMGGNYGGWTMLVLYEDEKRNLHYKNISVFNGFEYVDDVDNPTTININGFLTPHSGDIKGSVAFFAADGDPVVGGYMEMRNKKTTTFSTVSNASNPADNVFNSTMTEFGIPINAGITKTYGVDADRINISSFLDRDQSSTSFKFGAGTATQKDYYSLSFFAFATDLTTPIIDNFNKEAVIIGTDGSRRVAGPNEPIYPSSLLEYTITFTNTGDEDAKEVTIFDDFDFDGLTPALDTSHFDYTKLKLFEGSTTTTEINNPNCGYDIADRRVYCKLDTVEIGDSYTMQFTVTVKDALDSTTLEHSADNTAYAKYRNPNGNTYLEFYTTPITNESVGGKSNALNAGTFKPNDRSAEVFISVDAINVNYDYAQDRNITTKIVNQPFSIQLIHKSGREISDGQTPYQSWNQAIPMAVIVTLTNSTNTIPLNNPATDMFREGMSFLDAQLNLPQAHRNERLQMAYLNWHKLLSWSPTTSACRLNNTLSTNLNGLPACFNDYIYVKPIFEGDQQTIPAVADCYGKGTPANPTPPCNPLAYSTRGEPTGIITPQRYNHNFGCYQCLTDAFSNFRFLSSDNFAARPNFFDLNSTDPSFPDLLRSGSNYNLSLIARDGNTNNPSPTLDYNTTTARLSMDDPKKDPDGLKQVPLEGNTTINRQVINAAGNPEDSNISDGILRDENGDPAERIGFSFDNVGDVRLFIKDIDWASIDADDTPLVDCNDTSSPVNFRDESIEAYRGICGQLDTRFIPHHFALRPTLYNHNRTGRFTYLANDLNMSAQVQLQIRAENEQNQTTSNFKKDAYENPVSVNLSVTDWNTTFAVPTIRRDINGNRLDANISIKDIPTALTFGFGTGTDANGTHTIDSNGSTPMAQRILFNYARAINIPKNPFDINGSEANLTVNSRYTSTSTPRAQDGTADINGTNVASGSVTFYYGRVNPTKDYWEKIYTNSKVTPIRLDVFCDVSLTLNTNMCNSFGIDISNNGSIPGPDTINKWWRALKHDRANNDGNVTFTVSLGNGNITPTTLFVPLGTGIDNNITVTFDSANNVRPAVVDVDLVTATTSPWLIHNKASAIGAVSPFERLEFPVPPSPNNASNWTGHGATGNVIETNASIIPNQRLGW